MDRVELKLVSPSVIYHQCAIFIHPSFVMGKADNSLIRDRISSEVVQLQHMNNKRRSNISYEK
jgi:hypothetical protein